MIEKISLKIKAAAIIGLLLLGMGVWQWYNPSNQVTLWRDIKEPYIAETTKKLEDAPKVFLPPISIEKLDLENKKTLKKVSKILGREVNQNEVVLDVKDIAPLPYGGKAVLGLEYFDVGGEERSRLIAEIVPNKPPFFDWDLYRTIKIGAGIGTEGYVGRLELTQNIGRTGPVNWGITAGVIIQELPIIPIQVDGMVENGNSSNSSAYILVEGEARF